MISRYRGRQPNHRPGVKLAVGLVVEGVTEYYAMPRLAGLVEGCPPLRVAALHGVGSHVSAKGVAKMVVPKVLAHILRGCARVIVCLDRESRTESADALAASVLVEVNVCLKARGKSGCDVAVAVADRAFEAWILADARGLYSRGKFVVPPKFHSFEGAMGHQGKKGVVELDGMLGRAYQKTIDGPRLFTMIDFAAARDYSNSGTGSRSLDNLLHMLGV